MPKSNSNKGSAAHGVRVDQAIALIAKALVLVGSDTPPMTASDRRHCLKLRGGGEKFIPVLAALSIRNGIALPKRPTDAMVARIEEAQKLAPLRAAVAGLLTSIDDSVLRAQADGWKTAVSLYSILRTVALSDEQVAQDLSPMEQFFAKRHKSVKAKKKAKLGPTATTGQVPVSAVDPQQPAPAANGAVANGAVAHA